MIEGKQIFFTYGFAETDKNPVLNYVDFFYKTQKTL